MNGNGVRGTVLDNLGSLSPDRTESSGEISFTTTGTVLTASQSFGTFETQDGWVPFRNNSVTSGLIVVSGGLSGTYERRLNDDSDAIKYSAAANINQTLTGSTHNSSYVGIIGELVGYHLEKSTGAVAENISVSATDDNGQTSSSGNFTSSSNGTSDSLTTVKGTRIPQLGVTVTMEHFENGGVKFSDASAGVFSEDTEEVTDEFSVGSLNQSVYGNSVSKTNVTSIETNGTALSSSVDTTKFLVNVKGNGAVQSHDDEIISEFGNYSSDRFLKATSDQSLFATMNTTVGNTFTSSTLFFGTGTKISLVGGEGATASTVGDTTHSTGGFSSETNGSVKMGVTLQATMNTTNGPSIETATLSSTLGGGVVIKDNLGGYFIDSILVVGISGSESSNSTSQSKISITQTEPGSSLTQSIAQSDLSHDGSSYSVNIMQFGEIVGSVLGMFSGSSGGKSETKISSAGNSKSNTGTYWQSRAATLKSNQNVSLTGTITELGGSQLQPEGSTTGQPSNSGGAGASSNGFVLWTASVSDSIGGTITNGSFQPISVTIDDIVETGFMRSESTQDLRLSESVSLGSLAEPKSSSSFTIDGLTESLTVTVSAVLPPTNGGGNNPPGGTGTTTGGGVGSSNWRSSHEEISTSESSLSLSESKRGLSNSRSLTDDRTENRIVTHLIWDDNQSDRTSQRVGWGSTLEFTAGQGNHGEPYVSLLKTEFVIEQVETAHYVLKESAPSIVDDVMQMTDWVNTVTHLVQSRGSGNALQFTNRTRDTVSIHYEGSVNYWYFTIIWTPESSGLAFGATTASKLDTATTSHELLTSGPYGFEPTRTVVTDRTRNKTHFDSDTTSYSNAWNFPLEALIISSSHNTDERDSYSDETRIETTRRDKSPVVKKDSHADKFKFKTRYTKSTETPDNGLPRTFVDSGDDTVDYLNDVRGNRPAVGHLILSGNAYSSYQLLIPAGGGVPSDRTSYNIKVTWPEGGVVIGTGEPDEDGGSYDPNSLKQQQDDENSIEQDSPDDDEVKGLNQVYPLAQGQLEKWIRDGLAVNTAGNLYRIDTIYGAFIFEIEPGSSYMRSDSYAGPSTGSSTIGSEILGDLQDYGGNVLYFWKGYFWEAPKGVVTGAYELIVNFGDVLEAIQFLKDHPVEGGRLLGEGVYNEIMEKLETSEGQGQIAGDIALSIIPVAKIKLLAQASKYFKKFGKMMPDLTDEAKRFHFDERGSIGGDAPGVLPKLDGDSLGFWQKQLRNGDISEAELRKTFDSGSVDEVLRRLGRKSRMTHDQNKIIELIGKSSQAGAKAAKDFAEGRITQEAFEKIMDKLEGITAAQLDFWKRGLID